MGAAAPQNYIKHETARPVKREASLIAQDSVQKLQSAPSSAVPPLPPAPNPPVPPARPPVGPRRQLSQQSSTDESLGIEDTMTSLKKTFAGIFGDM
ncbi:unnamed protein product [Soboliphyme baturini]|uniref:Synapsin_C domain-containing protein n=1 Tax=Soboliphyme baturini TaxID=241478 RepID=A0A183J7A6_9BILA|nr:unnamed protein product [Soboliphyme baturini]